MGEITEKLRNPLIAFGVLVIVSGLVIGILVTKLGGLPMRWTVAMIALLSVAMVWPVYTRLTGEPWRLFWIVMILAIPLEFNVHLIYREYVGTFNGIILTITDAATAALLFVWIFHLALGKSRIRVFPSVTIPAVLFLTAHMVSIVNASDFQLSLFALVQNAKTFLFYWIVANHVGEENRHSLIWDLLMFCLILESGVCILQFITGSNFTTANLEVVENYGEEVFRVAGTTGSPNVTASYMASLLPIPIVSLLAREIPSKRWIVWLSFVMGSVALLLSQTRGAWITFAIGMGFFFAVLHRGKKTWKFMLVGAILIAAASVVFGPLILERMDRGTETLAYRINLIRSAWEMVKSHPLFGVGTNQYALVMGDYVPYFLTQERWIVHNRYLLVLAETGFVGFAFFLIFLVSVFRALIRTSRSKESDISAMGKGLLVALLVFILQMNFESLDGRISDSHIWLIAGLAAGLGNKANGSWTKKSEQP